MTFLSPPTGRVTLGEWLHLSKRQFPHVMSEKYVCSSFVDFRKGHLKLRKLVTDVGGKRTFVV